MCTKNGFSILRIVTLVIIIISIGLHLTGIIVPVWSEFQYENAGLEIHGKQNLWSLHVLKDEMDAYPPTSEINTGWKKSIVYLETSSLGIAIVGFTMFILQSSIIKIHNQFSINLILHAMATIMCLLSGILCGVGVFLYWFQKHKVFSVIARNPNNDIPLDDEMSLGLYIIIGSSLGYCTAHTTEIIGLVIMAHNSRSKSKQSGRVLPVTRRKREQDFDF